MDKFRKIFKKSIEKIKKLFSKTEVFEAFTYVYKNGRIAKPGSMTSSVRWLKDVTVTGLSCKEREQLAFKTFREQNNLTKGQVWIFGNYIKKG